MARSSSGSAKVVTALTAAALAVVAFLAYQAAAAPDAPTKKHRAAPSSSPPKSGGRQGATAPKSVPAKSGTGRRVVYALGAKRVWLVSAGNKARRSYEVTPSNVSPSPGRYRVTSRSDQITGSDGAPVEHVVRFALVDGVTVGFSAAVDGSTPRPAAGSRTGGVRSSRADGTAMWNFATVGTTVVVVK